MTDDVPTTPDALIRAVFAATDASDVAALDRLITDDVRLRFAGAPPTSGRERFLESARDFHESITSVSHDIDRLWTVGDVVIAELTVHYVRLDGGRLTLPCTDVFYLRDGLVCDYRIYMDIAPVYAEQAPA